MYLRKLLPLLILALVMAYGCKKQPSSYNLEQAGNPAGYKLMAPGLGTIGIIHDNQVFVYYLNESHSWILDKVSQFEIPEKNQGLLALGMGFMGVVQDDIMHFYYLNAENQWTRDQEVKFVLPKNRKKISTMRMPWDIGQIAVEDDQGVIHFFYINEQARWVKDETALFVLPAPLDSYLMLGSMEVGVIHNNKLGVYRLDDQGEWHWIENMVLTLPDNARAVISFEPGTIAVLLDTNILRFFDMDPLAQQWVMDQSMDFAIPAF